MQVSFDVIIVGRGVTGLSTAWHLKQRGVNRICLVGPNREFGSTASLNAGYASVTLYDNISRAAHIVGSPSASEILQLNRRGFIELANFTKLFGISCKTGQVLRISTSTHESDELRIAAGWLQSHGFPSALEMTDRSVVQYDGAASASLDINTLLNRLEEECNCPIFNFEIEGITTLPNGIEFIGADGTRLLGEMVVLGCHTGIKRLIPELSASLINFADQLIEFEIESQMGLLSAGNLIFSDHSQFWISSSYMGTLNAGGARYLRKWAGIEAESAPIISTVTAAVKNKIETLFNVKLGKAKRTTGILDQRACDELPIIGPMFGDSRILIAGGYMGNGLTFGCAAGKGLAEIIANGQSKTVPNLFHPSRLRSLPELD